MTRHVMHWDKSQRRLVPGPGPPRDSSPPIPGGGDQRGLSLQLPRWYSGAKKHTKQGYPMWESRREAEDIARRAQDNGDTGVQWDKHGGITK